MLFSAINYAAVAGGLAVLYPITAAPVAILSSAAADTAASSVQKRYGEITGRRLTSN